MGLALNSAKHGLLRDAVRYPNGAVLRHHAGDIAGAEATLRELNRNSESHQSSNEK